MAANASDIFTGVDWIDTNPIYLAIGATLAKDISIGDDLDENTSFDAVMSEMMKRGTLNHGSIRWQWVCDECVQLLTHEAKDLRLLLYLLLSLPYLQDIKNPLMLATALVNRFFNLWGETAFPNVNRRAPVLKNIVEALDILTDFTIKNDQDQTDINIVSEKIREIAHHFESHSALYTKLMAMSSRVEVSNIKEDENGLPSLERLLKEPVKHTPVLEVKEPVNNSTKPIVELHPENLALDQRNERALKQSLNSVSDFILNFDISNPLSYRLRRFSTWFGIQNPPEQRKRDDFRTVIQPVAANSLETYRIAAERGQMDLEIVQKLERSCNIQPFWIEGHYLSYQLAILCDRAAVAEAIIDETTKFVTKFSWLNKLQFSDGSPFMPENVLQWLSKQKTMPRKTDNLRMTAMIDDDTQSIIRKAREIANQGNIAEALKFLESSAPINETVRSKSLWELLVMECLSDWGAKNLIGSQALRLAASIRIMNVEEFEPDLIQRIERLNSHS